MSKRKLQFHPNYPTYGQSSPYLLPLAQRLGSDANLSGQGVVIAFIDSGFYPHPDLARRVRVYVDATTDDISEQATIGSIGMASWHGMMTTVVAAGDGKLSDGFYRGLAHKAELLLIKVSSPQMRVHESDIQRGLNWLLENHERFGVQVVNISAGGDYISTRPDHPIHATISQLVSQDIPVVVAAGNQGIKRLTPPATSPDAIVVGGYDDMNSTNQRRWRMYHSNYGYALDTSTKPDLVALAQWVPSPIMPDTPVEEEALALGPLLQDDPTQVLADLQSKHEQMLQMMDLTPKDLQNPSQKIVEKLQARIDMHKLVNSAYQHVDGTSVAAPIVTATIAQMLQVNPNLSAQDVKRILTHTARPLRGVPPIKQGAGVVHPAAATQLVRSSASTSRRNPSSASQSETAY